jgi:hypothetical protein
VVEWELGAAEECERLRVLTQQPISKKETVSEAGAARERSLGMHV